MTTQTEALKLALDALENHTAIKHPQQIHYRDKAITAIKEALAQPEHEPVGEIGWTANIPNTIREVNWTELCPPVGTKLYTTPPQRTWVGLTDDEIWDTPDYEETRKMYRFAKAIEAKLKEKNT